jgi:hypothetical protein
MNVLAALTLVFTLMQSTPPATFNGLYRGIESGRVVIEVENGQNMRMFVTGSTKFIRDGKRSKASEFHDGDAVAVDAERDIRMNLVAVRVEAVKTPVRSAPKTPPDDDSGKPN